MGIMDIGPDFKSLSDDGRRRLLIEELQYQRDVMLGRSASHRGHAAREQAHERGDGDGFLAWAAAYERQAAHYQQAIDLLTAAPMPPKDEPQRGATNDAQDPIAEKIRRATEILVSRGIKAAALSGSICVDSPLMPNYSVRGVDRERWTAEQIAEDIEKIENFDAEMRKVRGR